MFSLQPSERVKIWAATGFGEGTMMLSLEDGPVIEADIDWKMAAAGLRAELLTPEKDDGFALTSVSDALWSQTGSARLAAAGLHPGLEETESQNFTGEGGFDGKLDSAAGRRRLDHAENGNMDAAGQRRHRHRLRG